MMRPCDDIKFLGLLRLGKKSPGHLHRDELIVGAVDDEQRHLELINFPQIIVRNSEPPVEDEWCVEFGNIGKTGEGRLYDDRAAGNPDAEPTRSLARRTRTAPERNLLQC